MEPFSRLFRLKGRNEMKVDDHLPPQFDKQSLDYDAVGLSPEKTLVRGNARLSNIEKSSEECLGVETRRRVAAIMLSTVFIFSLLVGLFLRMTIPENHVKRVGDVMMMIGGLGILLVYFRQAGSVVRSSLGRLPLGLNRDSQPTGFDDQGRSPFDRVRTDN